MKNQQRTNTKTYLGQVAEVKAKVILKFKEAFEVMSNAQRLELLKILGRTHPEAFDSLIWGSIGMALWASVACLKGVSIFWIGVEMMGAGWFLAFLLKKYIPFLMWELMDTDFMTGYISAFSGDSAQRLAMMEVMALAPDRFNKQSRFYLETFLLRPETKY